MKCAMLAVLLGGLTGCGEQGGPLAPTLVDVVQERLESAPAIARPAAPPGREATLAANFPEGASCAPDRSKGAEVRRRCACNTSGASCHSKGSQSSFAEPNAATCRCRASKPSEFPSYTE